MATREAAASVGSGQPVVELPGHLRTGEQPQVAGAMDQQPVVLGDGEVARGIRVLAERAGDRDQPIPMQASRACVAARPPGGGGDRECPHLCRQWRMANMQAAMAQVLDAGAAQATQGGVPSDTSVSSLCNHGLPSACALAMAARDTSPPMLCARIAMRCTGTGQASTNACSKRENSRPLSAIDRPLL
jgi:hypothetical protein